MKRRTFLGQLALCSAFSVCRPDVVWASPTPPGNEAMERIIVIFLRGAVDGLNVVIPYQEDAYHDMRPTIAIPEPGTANGALKLDEQFALHPALAALMPFWQDKTLAFVHASGSPDATRSHFSAQAVMESGLGGSSPALDGWMNRLLRELPGPIHPTRAVNFGSPNLPMILTGSAPVASHPFGPIAEKPQPSELPEIEAVFTKLYAGDDALSRSYQEGMSARQRLMADLKQDMKAADRDAPSAAGFPGEVERISRMITGESRVQLAFIALGGWDTHIAQGGIHGSLAHRLHPLGEGLARLIKGLGTDYAHTTLIVHSEFGRTLAENGNGGTDHGHGNVMWILGGGIRGGKVYGVWPGLEKEKLFEQRDLAVTTDYRDVFGNLLKHRFQVTGPALSKVFPGFTPNQNRLKAMLVA